MKVEDIVTYLRLERERRWHSEGVTMTEIADHLGCSKRAAQRWVQKEVSAGRLMEVGIRKFLDSANRQNQQPTYQVIPHEA